MKSFPGQARATVKTGCSLVSRKSISQPAISSTDVAPGKIRSTLLKISNDSRRVIKKESQNNFDRQKVIFVISLFALFINRVVGNMLVYYRYSIVVKDLVLCR